MGPNIKATRRMSLSEFAIGWDDCYLIVNALSRDEATVIGQRMDEAEKEKDNAAADAVLSDFVTQHVLKGVILNTNDEGHQAPYEFNREEAPAVANALGRVWVIEALSVATGADRLKSKMN